MASNPASILFPNSEAISQALSAMLWLKSFSKPGAQTSAPSKKLPTSLLRPIESAIKPIEVLQFCVKAS